MSALYLIRHGQAGLRGNYDTLSDLGRQQARLLGDHLAADGVRFTAFYSGGLQRQIETAQQIAIAYQEAGIDLPAPHMDPLWNEFDLSGVYTGIAPQLAVDDAEFARHYADLQREAANEQSAVHRRWTNADVAVVRAWIEGRYRCDGESWSEFTARVRGTRHVIEQHGSGECIGVSTSATPIGIWTGIAMELEARHIMRTAGVLHNASFTTFRLRDGEISLFSLNNIPHLKDPALRTFR